MKLIQWLFPTYNERLVLALSGVMQSASLVDALANTGSCDPKAYERCLLALIDTNPENEDDIFGDRRELEIGVKQLNNFCNGGQQNPKATRYAIQMLHLQKLLYKRSDMQQKIHAGLLHARKQKQMYGLRHDNLALSLADLYQTTISTLGFRIQITGKHQLLQQDMIAARIRLLLFSGVRFAFLWRQSGGHAHHLVTARSNIGAETAQVMSKI